MRLLVPIDGSNASIGAVKKALELARKYNFSIKLISVVAEKNSEYRRHENAWRGVDGSIISESEELEKQLRSEERRVGKECRSRWKRKLKKMLKDC